MNIHWASRTLVVALFLMFLFATGQTIQICGGMVCRDEEVCCTRGNGTVSSACCQQNIHTLNYNIAMVTRKISGVLILLLIFASGYFLQRTTCRTQPQLDAAGEEEEEEEYLRASARPSGTMSQEPLVRSYTELSPLGAGAVSPLGAGAVSPLGAGAVSPLGAGAVSSLGAGAVSPGPLPSYEEVRWLPTYEESLKMTPDLTCS